jgi:hypothetical protein
VLSTLSDSHVRVLPENLGKPRVEALSDAIEQIYVDKVHGAPLVVCGMAALTRRLRAAVAVARGGETLAGGALSATIDRWVTAGCSRP